MRYLEHESAIERLAHYPRSNCHPFILMVPIPWEENHCTSRKLDSKLGVSPSTSVIFLGYVGVSTG